MRKLFKFIILGLNFLVVIALLMAYLSGYISPVKWWIPSFFGLAYPIIAVVNIIFIGFWLVISPKYLLISFIPLIAGWGFLTRYVQLKEKTTDSGDIKIMSYNVHHFRGDNTDSQENVSLEIIRFLGEHKPDIICLQEARLRQNRIFNLSKTVKDLEFINHYQFARSSKTFGSITMSRYPIIRMNEVRFEQSRNITIYTDLLIDTDTVRLFNVHLHSYGIDPKNFGIIDSGLKNEEDLQEARIMGSKLKTGFQIRASQVEAIQALIKESPYPVIVCGDLNDTPASYSYQQLSSGLNDAFISSGKGVGRTYINKLPSLRIDYIFHSDQFESFNFQNHNYRMSDHLPISTVLVRKSDTK